MAEVSSRQVSWDVELDAILSSVSGTAETSVASAETSATPAESDALLKLQGVLSLSALQILESDGLDSVGKCLNDLAAGGLINDEGLTHLSNALDRTREHFIVFERALRAEDEFKTAKAAQESIRPEIEAIKAKKEELADLDRQIAELQRRRSTAAAELEKDFESRKVRLTEYAAGVRRLQQLQFGKKTRQTDITMGEVRWLELKAALAAFLPSSP